jgi:hypothetical protein
MKWEHLPQKLFRDSGRKYEEENLEGAFKMPSRGYFTFWGLLEKNP